MNYQIGDTVFNDWEIVRYIGRGASGIVYEIQKREQGILHTSALKVLQIPSNVSVLDELVRDGMDESSVTDYIQSVVSELEDEVRIMVSLKGFPYIVNCEDSSLIRHPGIAQWDVLIRMELLSSFEDYRQDKDITEADIHTMALHLTRALKLFEQQNIIHRDIKPENIFVNEYGIYKVGDFGIARVYENNSGTLSVKGTDYYMAPEVFFHQDYDHTVDIYSLGLVLYRALNRNRLPFYPLDRAYTARDRHQAMTDRISGKKEMTPPCLASPDFGQIILKMCAYRPEDRYQSADELLTELNKIHPSNEVVLPKNEIKPISADQKETIPEANLTRNLFDGKKEIQESEIQKKERRQENLTRSVFGKEGSERPETDVTGDIGSKDHFDEKQAEQKETGLKDDTDSSALDQTIAGKRSGSGKRSIDSSGTNKNKKLMPALIGAGVLLFIIIFVFVIYKPINKTTSDTDETDAESDISSEEISVIEEAGDIPDTASTSQEVDNTSNSGSADTIIEIPDPVLKKVIQDTLGIGDREITQEDALLLTELSYDGYDVDTIKDISGLSEFKNLTRLKLIFNEISDFSALGELSKLTYLDLMNSEISDISFLSNLTNLSELNLSGNKIIDISPLADLTTLEYLDLQQNEINDISSLSGLTGLTYLDVGINDISDFSPLAGLSNLTKLNVGGNEPGDLSVLSGLTKLTFLGLVSMELDDLSFLSNMVNLDSINLRHNSLSELSQLSPLKPLTKLTHLYLGQNYLIKNTTFEEIEEYLSEAENLDAIN